MWRLRGRPRAGSASLDEFIVSLVALACISLGAWLGIRLSARLPAHHLSEYSREVVTIAIGLVATLAALVLGLLVASAKASFDARSDDIKQSAARIILLDRELRQYGADAAPIRALLKNLAQSRIDLAWGSSGDARVDRRQHADSDSIEDVQRRLRALEPRNDGQRWLQNRALSLSSDLALTRWLLLEQSRPTVSRPFLVVLVLWLVIIFASLGVFAPRNATVRTIIFVCALSVSTAIFLILEMDQPFGGLMQISNEPLRDAIAELGR